MTANFQAALKPPGRLRTGIYAGKPKVFSASRDKFPEAA